MNTTRLEKLKQFSDSNFYSNLRKVSNLVNGDFLTENLITKKEIEKRIAKITYCNHNYINHYNTWIDKKSGEIVDSEKIFLYGSDCGIYAICPICGRKRADVITAKYLPEIKEQIKKHEKAYMITFTAENQDNFNEGWELLTSSIRRFKRMGQKRTDRKGNITYSSGESAKIKSGLGCGEVKAGKNSGMYHIHFHYIVFCDEEIDYRTYDPKTKKAIQNYFAEMWGTKPTKKDLRAAASMPKTEIDKVTGRKKTVLYSPLSWDWKQATKGRGVNIDIRPLDTEKPIEKQVKEIIKYASKVNDLTTDMLFEILTFKDNKRFLSTWGELRKVEKEIEWTVEENEDTLKYDYAEMAAYDFKKGRYIQGDERTAKLAAELLVKGEELKEFRIDCNYARNIRDKFLNDLKPVVHLMGYANNSDRQTLDYKEKKQNLIREVDTIRKIYKYTCEASYRRIVKLNLLKNGQVRTKKVKTQREKYYSQIYSEALKRSRSEGAKRKTEKDKREIALLVAGVLIIMGK